MVPADMSVAVFSKPDAPPEQNNPRLQVQSDLQAAGRALAETSAEECSSLACAIFGELERRELQHDERFRTGWPRDALQFRTFIWQQIQENMPRFAQLLRQHCRVKDGELDKSDAALVKLLARRYSQPGKFMCSSSTCSSPHTRSN